MISKVSAEESAYTATLQGSNARLDRGNVLQNMMHILTRIQPTHFRGFEQTKAGRVKLP